MPIVFANQQKEAVDVHGNMKKALAFSRETLDATRSQIYDLSEALKGVCETPNSKERNNVIHDISEKMNELVEVLNSECQGRPVVDAGTDTDK
jgi:uncharacterized glyoxalase superfamily protein PhnB